MPQLPTGTVTFLFTDIEGSTRLVQELGPRYSDVLAAHAAIMRASVAVGGGIVLGTEGDSLFAVFDSPGGAVTAAITAQRELAAHEWSHGDALMVRMGLHTGEGVLGGDNYVGIDVNRAARIAAAAHGGQVLISEATRSLVEQSLPEGASLLDLGEHRLKDIQGRERLHHLVIAGLRTEFPPPRTLEARPNNLPLQLTSFVGRERELEEVREMLTRTRLLTLTGPGGTGKTRLALQLAETTLPNYRDGSFFVDLSALTDPTLVASAVAQALDVHEVPGRPLIDVVKDHVRDRELLLVFDNFEQVAEAGALVEELLTSAPKLKSLVTSRVVLSVRGEQEYLVPPLEPPDLDRLPDVLTLGRFEAVQLFAERAVAVRPGFRVTEDNAPAVAEITARLDGLPLAIELAASRTKVLTPQQILPRLQNRMAILTTGARTLPERQRTLRAAIAWSYDLLEQPDQELFEQLSAFTGGWTLASAESVCASDDVVFVVLEGLTSLADKSLIRRNDPASGEPRFSMLETIREFGLERLGARGKFEQLLARHADHFLRLVEEAEPHLTAQDQGVWLDRAEAEHANIRSALRWAIAAGDADRAQRTAGALWRFWQQRGHLAEATNWFEEILAMPSGQSPTPARASALIGAGGIAWWRQEREVAGGFYREAVDIERQLGDPARTAEALYNYSFFVAGDDLEAATRLLEESRDLFRRAGDERGVAQVMALMVMPDAQAGRWDRVIPALEEVVSIWRGLGDRLHVAFDLIWLAFALGRAGRREEARDAGLEALELFREADNPTGLGITLIDLAFLATWEGRHEDAIRLAAAYESLRKRVGGPPGAIGGIMEGDPAEEARNNISKESADGAWDEGLAMSLDEAVDYARAQARSRANS